MVLYVWGAVYHACVVMHKEAPTFNESHKGRKRGERRERAIKKSKESPKSRVAPTRFGLSTLGRLGWCGEPRTRGPVRFRLCEDRSDVLFELSAAEGRRLYMPESARDQSDTYLMLMAFFPWTSHAFVSAANSVIKTPVTASIIVARSAPRSKSLSPTDSPISIRKVATVTRRARRNFPSKWLIRSAMDVSQIVLPTIKLAHGKEKKKSVIEGNRG